MFQPRFETSTSRIKVKSVTGHQPAQRTQNINTATWRLKAGIVEPEESFIAGQRFGKQVSAEMDTQAVLE
jgi:hypothetical protein